MTPQQKIRKAAEKAQAARVANILSFIDRSKSKSCQPGKVKFQHLKDLTGKMVTTKVLSNPGVSNYTLTLVETAIKSALAANAEAVERAENLF